MRYCDVRASSEIDPSSQREVQAHDTTSRYLFGMMRPSSNPAWVSRTNNKRFRKPRYSRSKFKILRVRLGIFSLVVCAIAKVCKRDASVTLRTDTPYDSLPTIPEEWSLENATTGCMYPPATAVVTCFHESRFSNLELILAKLRKVCFIQKVIVWNNNAEAKVSLSKGNFIKVVNSVHNIGTRAKYEACSWAQTETCYIIDDDWLPIHLEALYHAYLRQNSSTIVALTDARTQFMDVSYTFRQDNHSFGFAWLGVGSFVPKQYAVRFLHLMLMIPPEFSKHEDFFFTMFMDVPPLPVSTKIIPLRQNDGEFKMSAQHGYLQFQLKGWMKAFDLVVSHPELFAVQTAKTCDSRTRDVRAICSDGERMVLSNLSPSMITHSRRCKQSSNNVQCKFEVDSDAQEQFSRAPYEQICDHTLSKCFFLPALYKENYIGYEFVTTREISIITLVLEVPRAHYRLPRFQLDVVQTGRKNFVVMPFDMSVHFDRVQRSSKAEAATYAVMKLVFVPQLIRAVRLRSLSDYHGHVRICEISITLLAQLRRKVASLSVRNQELLQTDDIGLVVAVTSAADNYLRRYAIRQMIQGWSSTIHGLHLLFSSDVHLVTMLPYRRRLLSMVMSSMMKSMTTTYSL